MHQVRIFIGVENDVPRVTAEINGWLRSSNAKVVNIFGNIAPQTTSDKGDTARLLGAENASRRHAPSDIMLVVVYEEAP